MRTNLWKKILVGLLAILLVMQLFRIDKTNPPIEAAQEFRQVMAPPHEVQQLLEVSCYDCHSHETRYPWYSNVAPFSWMLQNHVVEGREHFNFSTFGSLPADERAELLHESAEEIEKKKMPLEGYTALHPEAVLTAEQRTLLARWFRNSNPGGRSMEEAASDDREEEAEH